MQQRSISFRSLLLLEHAANFVMLEPSNNFNVVNKQKLMSYTRAEESRWFSAEREEAFSRAWIARLIERRMPRAVVTWAHAYARPARWLL